MATLSKTGILFVCTIGDSGQGRYDRKSWHWNTMILPCHHYHCCNLHQNCQEYARIWQSFELTGRLFVCMTRDSGQGWYLVLPSWTLGNHGAEISWFCLAIIATAVPFIYAFKNTLGHGNPLNWLENCLFVWLGIQAKVSMIKIMAMKYYDSVLLSFPLLYPIFNDQPRVW